MRSTLYLRDQLFSCCSWVRKFETNFMYKVQEEFNSNLFQFSRPKFNSSTTFDVYSLTKPYQNPFDNFGIERCEDKSPPHYEFISSS